MVRYVETYRDLLYETAGRARPLCVSYRPRGARLAIGTAIFRRFESRLAEEL